MKSEARAMLIVLPWEREGPSTQRARAIPGGEAMKVREQRAFLSP